MTESHKGSGIRSKLARTSLLLLIATGLSAVCGVAIVEISLAQYQLRALSTQIRKTLTTRGESLAHSHAFVFRTLVADTAVIEMQSTIGSTVGGRDDVVYGMYMSAEGRIWAYCSPESPCKPAKSQPELLRHEKNQVLPSLGLGDDAGKLSKPAVREAMLFRRRVLEFAEPVFVDEALVGVLRYGISTESLDDALALARQTQMSLTIRSLGAFVIGFMGIVALGLYFARRTAERIARPISDLTRAAERFARGEHHVKVEVSSGDEVQILGEAFNHMVTDLELSYLGLETKNRELEAEIEERISAQNERTELQNHLIQSQKMEAFGQLAGGVAHDFNNILAVVIGNTELASCIMEEEPISEELKTLNQEVKAAAGRGVSLTRQLLTFARRESDNPRVVDVNETLRGFSKLIRRMLEESVELELTPNESISKIRIDPGRLEQVLMNLCVNARDAMAGGGTIQLATGETQLGERTSFTTGPLDAGKYVWIRARDTGSGMPQAVIDRIFEPFFTTKPVGRGTGLGLAMVHSIVQGAGGAVSIDSVCGSGTTFTIYLPAYGGVDREERAKSEIPASIGQGHRVLLCEDDAAVSRMTRQLLERGGYRVTETNTPGDALELLRDQSFDLLLTDVVMPGMNGKELAVQARMFVPNLPILFVSGYTAGLLTAHGVRMEDLHFLRKPFQSRELLERVQALIAARRESIRAPG